MIIKDDLHHARNSLPACSSTRAGPRRSWASPSISLIGSFRRHYGLIRDIAEFFLANGVTVPSPSFSRILDPEASYLRFECDPPELSDHDIQAVTLARLLASEAVYVVAPGGYIGLDTSMEIGHILQARVPLFFSAPIKNVTTATGPISVLSPARLLAQAQLAARAALGERT